MAATPVIHDRGTPALPLAPRRGLRILVFSLLLAALAAASAWHLHAIDLRISFNQSDLLPRWLGTRLALHGQDPYSLALLRPMQQAYHLRPQPFLYPATIVILLAPLAPLSMEAARIVFLAVVFPLLVLALWFCTRRLNLPASRTGRVLVLLAALLSWPVLWGIRMQQPTLLVAGLLFISWSLLARGHELAPGILLALTTIKPQLVLPFFLWLLLWAILQRRWILIASFAGTLALLLLAAERIVPGWFPRWHASLAGYNATEHAAPALEHLFGHWFGLALTLLLTLCAVGALWLLRRCDAASPQFATALSLGLALPLLLFSSQPLMIYNNVLLFPAIVLLLFTQPHSGLASALRWLAFLQLALDFLFVPVAALGEAITGPSTLWIGLPFLDYLLPALVTAVFASEILQRSSATPVVSSLSLQPETSRGGPGGI